jgi:tRNA (guanine37-N1)-methyltransferase
MTLSLRDALALTKKFTKKELSFATNAYDSLGNIAVIEIPEELSKKKILVGQTLLKINPRFETVCSIESNHEGKFRVQKVKVIAGKKQKVATYKESGCTFQVPLGEVFFTPRLSGERLRIAKEIKANEIVGTWFSGIGPYPIVFEKNSVMQKAIAIELNPRAHEFALKNSVLNKCKKIEFVKGDVKRKYKKYLNFFDRITMPLPHTGYQFLKEAISCVKKGGIIHFYEIVVKGDYETPRKQIIEMAKTLKRKATIQREARVRVFSPTKEQVVFDIKIQ